MSKYKREDLKTLKHSGAVCTACLNIKKLYILPTQCDVFFMIEPHNRDYFTNSINWPVSIMTTVCGTLYIIWMKFGLERVNGDDNSYSLCILKSNTVLFRPH